MGGGSSRRGVSQESYPFVGGGNPIRARRVSCAGMRCSMPSDNSNGASDGNEKHTDRSRDIRVRCRSFCKLVRTRRRFSLDREREGRSENVAHASLLPRSHGAGVASVRSRSGSGRGRCRHGRRRGEYGWSDRIRRARYGRRDCRRSVRRSRLERRLLRFEHMGRLRVPHGRSRMPPVRGEVGSVGSHLPRRRSGHLSSRRKRCKPEGP